MKLILSIAFPLFLMMDPVGNIPLYISFLKDLPAKRQRWIIVRELLIALFIIILFNFLGNALFKFLKVSQSTATITGGIILFLIAIKMIFPPEKRNLEILDKNQEPFIVPLAVPLIAGPSVLAVVMLYSQQVSDHAIMIGAITISWGVTLAILVLSPMFGKFLGTRGIIACERLMGLILVMIGVQMLLEGIAKFVTYECIIKSTIN